jgi:subtilase family serine protease
MAVFTRAFALIAFGSAMTACVTQPASTDDPSADPSSVPSSSDDTTISAVCSGGRLHCKAQRVEHKNAIQAFATAPQGFGPADFASAYNIDTTVNSNATIAIVDAFGYPTLEADLAMYRSTFGLPACTSASGCLKIVNTSGQTSPLPSKPTSADDWTTETALDVDMASAACPTCKLLVIQASDDQGTGLEDANNTAAMLGATVVSNSWGGPASSFSDLTTDEATTFNHTGMAIFVATGDNGWNQDADYPSTGEHVIGVGGTSLTQDTSARGWSESAWSDGGSSCNADFAQPAWQAGGVVPAGACTGRANSDVSAVADPNTGVAIYNNSRVGRGDTGWGIVGGTSAASPLVAGIFAITGHGNADTAQIAYKNTAAFYDVTSGTNGACGSELCDAAAGWDGPTGIGTPNAKLLAAVSGGNGSGSGSGSGMGSGSAMGSNMGSNTGSNTGSNGDNNGGNGSSGGGCAAGGGAGLGTMLFGLGLALSRRRRAE